MHDHHQSAENVQGGEDPKKENEEKKPKEGGAEKDNFSPMDVSYSFCSKKQKEFYNILIHVLYLCSFPQLSGETHEIGTYTESCARSCRNSHAGDVSI